MSLTFSSLLIKTWNGKVLLDLKKRKRLLTLQGVFCLFACPLSLRTKPRAHFMLTDQKFHPFFRGRTQSKNVVKRKHFLNDAFISPCRRDKGGNYLRTFCAGNRRREMLSRCSKLQSILERGVFRARRMQTARLDNFNQPLFKKDLRKGWYRCCCQCFQQ